MYIVALCDHTRDWVLLLAHSPIQLSLFLSVFLSVFLSLSVSRKKKTIHITRSLLFLYPPSPSLHKSQYIGLNVHTINYNPIVLYDHHSHIQIYVHYIKLSPASEWPWLWMEHRIIVNSFIDLILELESIHCASLKTPKRSFMQHLPWMQSRLTLP